MKFVVTRKDLAIEEPCHGLSLHIIKHEVLQSGCER